MIIILIEHQFKNHWYFLGSILKKYRDEDFGDLKQVWPSSITNSLAMAMRITVGDTSFLGAFGFGVVDYRLFDVNFLLFDIVFMFDAICFWVASSWFSCCLGRTTPFDFILFWLVGGVKSFFVSIPAGVWEWRKMKPTLTIKNQNPKAHERHLSGICGAESSWRRSCRCPGKGRKVNWWDFTQCGDLEDQTGMCNLLRISHDHNSYNGWVIL